MNNEHNKTIALEETKYKYLNKERTKGPLARFIFDLQSRIAICLPLKRI